MRFGLYGSSCLVQEMSNAIALGFHPEVP